MIPKWSLAQGGRGGEDHAHVTSEENTRKEKMRGFDEWVLLQLQTNSEKCLTGAGIQPEKGRERERVLLDLPESSNSGSKRVEKNERM